MIDVSHPSAAEFSHQVAYTNHDRHNDVDHKTHDASQASQEAEDAEEAAWLQSIQSTDITEVKGLQSGTLVMDIGQLRQEATPSSAKKVAKSAIR